MNIDQFNEIIDYAIEREQEAVDFYHELRSKAKFTARIQLLEELENMEKGHIEILNNIKAKGFQEIDIPEVTDLKISDYIIFDEPKSELTYEEIIILAMKREERSFKLYSDLASEFKDTDIEPIFRKIASEEAKHKLKFEQIYDEEVLKNN